MDSIELRAMQAPLKERYKADPGAALVTLRARGMLGVEKIACKIETGRALTEAGLHPAAGGTGAVVFSGDVALVALVPGAGVRVKSVAKASDGAVRVGL